MNKDGSFVAIWTSWGQDGDGDGVFGQRYDHTGTPQGPEFQINTFSTDGQSDPDIAMDRDGNFLAVWKDNDQPEYGGTGGIFGQRYDFTGAPIGSEFQVNTSSLNSLCPTVAMNDHGNAWVAWRMNSHVFAQGFDHTGAQIGNELQVNTGNGGNQCPTIALTNSDHAVIAWNSWEQDGDSDGIFAQRFQPNQAPYCGADVGFPGNLFANDHAFHEIGIGNVWDLDGDLVTITVTDIYQDEAVNAPGTEAAPDGFGISSNAASVRAEHVPQGNGRTYRIGFTLEDEWGATCSGTVSVRSGALAKGDADAIIYDSTTFNAPNMDN